MPVRIGRKNPGLSHDRMRNPQLEQQARNKGRTEEYPPPAPAQRREEKQKGRQGDRFLEHRAQHNDRQHPAIMLPLPEQERERPEKHARQIPRENRHIVAGVSE